jgi:hypothetical protein
MRLGPCRAAGRRATAAEGPVAAMPRHWPALDAGRRAPCSSAARAWAATPWAATAPLPALEASLLGKHPCRPSGLAASAAAGPVAAMPRHWPALDAGRRAPCSSAARAWAATPWAATAPLPALEASLLGKHPCRLSGLAASAATGPVAAIPGLATVPAILALHVTWGMAAPQAAAAGVTAAEETATAAAAAATSKGLETLVSRGRSGSAGSAE